MKLGEKVHCHAYLQKFSDGVHLETWDRTDIGDFGYIEEPAKGNAWGKMISVKAMKTEYTAEGYKTKEIADLSDFEGNTVPKQYRRRIKDEFDGVFVGFTHIVVSGEIGTDMTMMPYNMSGDLEEVYHLTKHTNKEKVGVIYFKNNARRYVPVEDMERKEE